MSPTRTARVFPCVAYLLGVVAILSLAAAARGADPAVKTLEPRNTYRGSVVTGTATEFPPETKGITVTVGGKELPGAVVSEESKSFSFSVPSGLPLGPHVVRVRFVPKTGAGAEAVFTPADDRPFRVLRTTSKSSRSPASTRSSITPRTRRTGWRPRPRPRRRSRRRIPERGRGRPAPRSSDGRRVLRGGAGGANPGRAPRVPSTSTAARPPGLTRNPLPQRVQLHR